MASTNIAFADKKAFEKFAQENPSRVLVIYNKSVFDVADFLDEHPGGPAFILDFQNQDITQIFHDDEYHEHSSTALSTLLKRKIGYIQ